MYASLCFVPSFFIGSSLVVVVVFFVYALPSLCFVLFIFFIYTFCISEFPSVCRFRLDERVCFAHSFRSRSHCIISLGLFALFTIAISNGVYVCSPRILLSKSMFTFLTAHSFEIPLCRSLIRITMARKKRMKMTRKLKRIETKAFIDEKKVLYAK